MNRGPAGQLLRGSWARISLGTATIDQKPKDLDWSLIIPPVGQVANCRTQYKYTKMNRNDLSSEGNIWTSSMTLVADIMRSVVTRMGNHTVEIDQVALVRPLKDLAGIPKMSSAATIAAG